MHINTEEGNRNVETKESKWWFSFRDKDHPVWGILKPFAALGFVFAAQKMFATSFDSTEIKTLLMSGAGFLFLEGINGRKK